MAHLLFYSSTFCFALNESKGPQPEINGTFCVLQTFFRTLCCELLYKMYNEQYECVYSHMRSARCKCLSNCAWISVTRPFVWICYTATASNNAKQLVWFIAKFTIGP